MGLAFAFAVGVLVGWTLSERRFEAMVRGACAVAVAEQGGPTRTG
jgi:hypothetical protein